MTIPKSIPDVFFLFPVNCNTVETVENLPKGKMTTGMFVRNYKVGKRLPVG